MTIKPPYLFRFETPHTGKTVPTQEQLNTRYAGTSLEGLVTVTSGIQQYVVTYPGTYMLKAAGARGGHGSVRTQASRDAKYGVGGTGAIVGGTIELLEGDIIKVLVGQRGTDCSIVNGDATTSAGGGGTFVELIREGSTFLLLAAAGGCGNVDCAYKGDSFSYIVHGSSATTTQFYDYDYVGGGYNKWRGTQYCGRSYTDGGAAAPYSYSRNTTSYPGFGGGGSNGDDTTGGGGGGYYGGINDRANGRSYSASSYINPDLITEEIRLCDSASNGSGNKWPANPVGNNDNGYFELTFIKPPYFSRFFFKKDDEPILYYLTEDEELAEADESLINAEYVYQGAESVSKEAYKRYTDEGYILVEVSTNLETDELGYAIIAKAYPTVIDMPPFDVSEYQIVSVNADAPETTLMLVSTDNSTWKRFNREEAQWETVAKSRENAHTIQMFSELTHGIWDKLGCTNNLYISTFIDPDNYEPIQLAGVTVVVRNKEGI